MTIPHEEEQATETILPVSKPKYFPSTLQASRYHYDSLNTCPPATISNTDNPNEHHVKSRRRSESSSSELSSFDQTLTAEEGEQFRILTQNISSVTLAPSEYNEESNQHNNNKYQNSAEAPPPSSAAFSENSPLLSFPSLPTEYVEEHSPTSHFAKYPGGKMVISGYRRISKYMSPPLWAALAALFVGLTPLKPILFDKHRFLYPSLTKAIESCGSVAVPIILVCLGAQLSSFSLHHRCSSSEMKKPIAASVCIRMFLMPFFVIPLTTLFIAYGEGVSSLASDPVFAVVMIMIGCSPTAINLVQMTQVYPNFFEEEMLRVLFWSYGVICTPIMTMVVLLALEVVQKVT
jgi:hypothetical protein